MTAINIDSPFLDRNHDWKNISSWLVALIITATLHSLLNGISIPPPLQHAGNNDWRIISSVQFLPTEKKTAPKKQQSVVEKTNKPTTKPKPIEKKKRPPNPAIKQPISSNKVAEKPLPKPEPLKSPAQPEVIEEPIQLDEPQQEIVLADEKPQQEIADISEPQTEQATQEETPTETKPQQDMSQVVNNLTASIVTQPAGKPLAEYRSQVIDKINANKRYPNTARRRGIQGDVVVKFTIADDGNVIDLECLGDTKILSRSACEAIKKSLPFPAPQQAQMQLSFVMDYVLR